MLQLIEVGIEGDSTANVNGTKKRKRKERGCLKMICKRKEWLTDNSQLVAVMQENKMNTARTQQVCRDTESIILSPKVSKQQKNC